MSRVYKNKRDWNCTKCNQVNWGRNGKCFVCNEYKPKHLLDGDWYCLSCGDYQFKKNTTCRKCNNPRPQIMQEEDDFDDLEIEDACVICLTKKRSCTIVHGVTGHNVTCMSCAMRISHCPICRQRIENRIKIFS